MMRCPTCNRTVAEGTRCQRCGRDLNEYIRLSNLAETRFQLGKKHLAAGKFQAACQAFRAADNLYHSDQTRQGLAVTLLCLGRYREALKLSLQSTGAVVEQPVKEQKQLPWT